MISPFHPTVTTYPVENIGKDLFKATFKVMSPTPLPAEGVSRYTGHLMRNHLVAELKKIGVNQINTADIAFAFDLVYDDKGQPDQHGFIVSFVVIASKDKIVIN